MSSNIAAIWTTTSPGELGEAGLPLVTVTEIADNVFNVVAAVLKNTTSPAFIKIPSVLPYAAAPSKDRTTPEDVDVLPSWVPVFFTAIHLTISPVAVIVSASSVLP